MPGLLGSHSSNPGGNPETLAAMQQLQQAAAAGDARARTTLQTIANGGKTLPGEVPGINEKIDWSGISGTQALIGKAKGSAVPALGADPGRAAERQAAQALLSGDTQGFAQLADAAQAAHKDWTGGTLAKVAPIAAGFIPGIGPLAAAGIGAAMGAAGSATGLTNDSVLAGAARGGVEGGATNAVRGLINKPTTMPEAPTTLPPAPDMSGIPGAALPPAPDMSGIPGAPIPGSGLAEGMANTMGNSPAISGGYTPSSVQSLIGQSALPAVQAATNKPSSGGGVLGFIGSNLPTIAQGGLAALGTIQGASSQGEADRLRREALASGLNTTPVSLGNQYIDTTNPYAQKRQGLSPAQEAARRALSGY